MRVPTLGLSQGLLARPGVVALLLCLRPLPSGGRSPPGPQSAREQRLKIQRGTCPEEGATNLRSKPGSLSVLGRALPEFPAAASFCLPQSLGQVGGEPTDSPQTLRNRFRSKLSSRLKSHICSSAATPLKTIAIIGECLLFAGPGTKCSSEHQSHPQNQHTR